MDSSVESILGDDDDEEEEADDEDEEEGKGGGDGERPMPSTGVLVGALPMVYVFPEPVCP